MRKGDTLAPLSASERNELYITKIKAVGRFDKNSGSRHIEEKRKRLSAQEIANALNEHPDELGRFTAREVKAARELLANLRRKPKVPPRF